MPIMIPTEPEKYESWLMTQIKNIMKKYWYDEAAAKAAIIELMKEWIKPKPDPRWFDFTLKPDPQPWKVIQVAVKEETINEYLKQDYTFVTQLQSGQVILQKTIIENKADETLNKLADQVTQQVLNTLNTKQ